MEPEIFPSKAGDAQGICIPRQTRLMDFNCHFQLQDSMFLSKILLTCAKFGKKIISYVVYVELKTRGVVKNKRLKISGRQSKMAYVYYIFKEEKGVEDFE